MSPQLSCDGVSHELSAETVLALHVTITTLIIAMNTNYSLTLKKTRNS